MNTSRASFGIARAARAHAPRVDRIAAVAARARRRRPAAAMPVRRRGCRAAAPRKNVLELPRASSRSRPCVGERARARCRASASAVERRASRAMRAGSARCRSRRGAGRTDRPSRSARARPRSSRRSCPSDRRARRARRRRSSAARRPAPWATSAARSRRRPPSGSPASARVVPAHHALQLGELADRAATRDRPCTAAPRARASRRDAAERGDEPRRSARDLVADRLRAVAELGLEHDAVELRVPLRRTCFLRSSAKKNFASDSRGAITRLVARCDDRRILDDRRRRSSTNRFASLPRGVLHREVALVGAHRGDDDLLGHLEERTDRTRRRPPTGYSPRLVTSSSSASSGRTRRPVSRSSRASSARDRVAARGSGSTTTCAARSAST